MHDFELAKLVLFFGEDQLRLRDLLILFEIDTSCWCIVHAYNVVDAGLK